MQAIRLTICALLLLTTSAMADNAAPLKAGAGQWSTVLSIRDHLNNHYLLKTSVHDDAETCAAQLHKVAGKIRQAGGMVWTNHAKSTLAFDRQSGGTEIGVKVLDIRCVLEPYAAEFVNKL